MCKLFHLALSFLPQAVRPQKIPWRHLQPPPAPLQEWRPHRIVASTRNSALLAHHQQRGREDSWEPHSGGAGARLGPLGSEAGGWAGGRAGRRLLEKLLRAWSSGQGRSRTSPPPWMDWVSRPEEGGKKEVKTVGERRGGEKGAGRARGSRVAGTLRSLTFSGSIVLAGWFLGGEAVREKRQSSQVCWEQQGWG